jgi:hypothetical protein
VSAYWIGHPSSENALESFRQMNEMLTLWQLLESVLQRVVLEILVYTHTHTHTHRHTTISLLF